MMCAFTGEDRGSTWMMAFRAGDTAKFALILHEYRGPVIAYLSRMVRDRAVAEELAQEVFLRVYRSRNYEPSATFRCWIIRIAGNLARNWLRDHRKDDAVLRLDHPPAGGVGPTPRSPVPNIEERMVADCRLQDVRAAVESLPERHRAAVVMHKFLEMDYWEIARVQNCSVSAVKSLLFRAYESLRKRLAHLDPATTESAACLRSAAS